MKNAVRETRPKTRRNGVRPSRRDASRRTLGRETPAESSAATGRDTAGEAARDSRETTAVLVHEREAVIQGIAVLSAQRKLMETLDRPLKLSSHPATRAAQLSARRFVEGLASFCGVPVEPRGK